jgi:hypothetical protein
MIRDFRFLSDSVFSKEEQKVDCALGTRNAPDVKEREKSQW